MPLFITNINQTNLNAVKSMKGVHLLSALCQPKKFQLRLHMPHKIKYSFLNTALCMYKKIPHILISSAHPFPY